MPANPNARRTWATYRILGRAPDPSQVTAALGIHPSDRHRRGQQRGTAGTWTQGYWSLSSRHHVRSTDLEQHLVWLLNRLEPVREPLRHLLSTDVQADLFCFWESRTGHGGPVFSPGVLRRLGELDAVLGIDIYFAS